MSGIGSYSHLAGVLRHAHIDQTPEGILVESILPKVKAAYKKEGPKGAAKIVERMTGATLNFGIGPSYKH